MLITTKQVSIQNGLAWPFLNVKRSFSISWYRFGPGLFLFLKVDNVVLSTRIQIALQDCHILRSLVSAGLDCLRFLYVLLIEAIDLFILTLWKWHMHFVSRQMHIFWISLNFFLSAATASHHWLQFGVYLTRKRQQAIVWTKGILLPMPKYARRPLLNSPVSKEYHDI